MRIGIIGAGISGLTAAYALKQQGHEVAVFERAPHSGGFISTFDFNGITIERFYHFLCKGDTGYFNLCRELGIADRLRWAPSKTGFYYQGKTYPFTTPLDLLRFNKLTLTERIRFGLFALECRMREDWVQLDRKPAKAWLIDRIGQRAYDMIWHPLLAFKFGDLHEDLSAAWVWHRVHRVAKSGGKLGYLEGGSGVLLDVFTERIRSMGVELQEGRSVETLLEADGSVAGIRFTDGEIFPCDCVVSTTPLPVLANLLPDNFTDYADSLRRVSYVGVVCAVFKLRKAVTGNFWLNIHDARMASNGIIEFTNLNPIMGEDGAIVYVPYYTATDTPRYQAGDETIIDESWAMLKTINNRLTDGDRLDVRVFRAPYAQAVCPVDFLSTQPAPEAPLRGLHLLDSTFLYPEDRTQAGLIDKAYERAAAIGPA